MLLIDYLVDKSAVKDNTLAVMSWEEVEPVFHDVKDLDGILRATISLRAGGVTIDPEHTDLLASSPLAAWVLAELLDDYRELLVPSPLALYRAIMTAEQIATDNTELPEVVALNLHGLARLFHEHIGDYLKAIDLVEKFLEFTEPYGWFSLDFPMAGYVLYAACEHPEGKPIVPIGRRVLSVYENRITQVVEGTDPGVAYTELQLLEVWQEYLT